MKKYYLINLLFAYLLTFSINAFSIDNIKVNTKASTVKWLGSKITESHSGTINIKSGNLLINNGKLSGGNFVIDMTSIVNTDIESERGRKSIESHLKNEDFFDVDKYKTSSLKITKVNLLEDNHYKLEADLTIKGITHSISFLADIKIKGNAFLATANIKIDRTKWGVTYKSGNVFKDLGDKAILDEIEFDIFLLSEK